MNILKIVVFLLNLLKELERKINLFLDYVCGYDYSLETIAELISAPFYFYCPSREINVESKKCKAETKKEYLECTTLQQENCFGILVNKIDREFRQWIEWNIASIHRHHIRVWDEEYAKTYPKLLDTTAWEKNNFGNFKRNQLKIISAKAALIITKNNKGELLILKVEKQSSGRKSKLVVKVCNHTMSNDDPYFEHISRSKKSGYKLKVKNWRITKTLTVNF